MTTTVLLLSVDEAPMLAHSLPAALAQEPVPEVVVVDNASTDETAELARRHGARICASRTRLSYAAAINQAIGATGGEAVLLLNADCFLRPGFLAAALARWPIRASARWPPSCCASPLPTSRWSRSMPPGCSSTAGARTASSATAAPAPRFGLRRGVRSRRCGGAVPARARSRTARCPMARCSTRTWSCGPRTPIWPGARGCSAGAACTSRARWPSTSAPTARRPDHG